MTTSAQPKLIGLGGKLRSGKDAFADYLVEHHGYVKMGMSDILHESAMAMNPIISAAAYLDAEPGGYRATLESFTYKEATEEYGYVRAKEEFPEYRAFLQRMGTEFGRNIIDENLWVNLTARRIDNQWSLGKSVVLTGVRFPNELTMVTHEFGGRSIWINRPSLQTQSATLAAIHASENGVNEADFDIVVQNDGDLEELYAKAKVLA